MFNFSLPVVISCEVLVFASFRLLSINSCSCIKSRQQNSFSGISGTNSFLRISLSFLYCLFKILKDWSKFLDAFGCAFSISSFFANCWKLRICLIANSTIWAFVHFWSLSLASWKLGKSDANLSRRALKRDLRSFSYLLNRVALERKKKRTHVQILTSIQLNLQIKFLLVINLLFFTFLGFQRHVEVAFLTTCGSSNVMWDIYSAQFQHFLH